MPLLINPGVKEKPGFFSSPPAFNEITGIFLNPASLRAFLKNPI